MLIIDMGNNWRVLFFIEATGGGVFTCIVDLANELVNDYEMYIAYAVRPQTPADVFLLTSLWEGLHISLLEVMYMKRLCVVSVVIGNQDASVNGFICHEVDSFVYTLQKRLNSQRDGLVENVFLDILTHYNIKCMAEQYALIYSGGGISFLVFFVWAESYFTDCADYAAAREAVAA